MSSAGLVKPPNELAKHDDEGYFDEKGNRILEDKFDAETGASWKVEKVRASLRVVPLLGAHSSKLIANRYQSAPISPFT